jgi:hypothetical protein
MSEVLGCGPWRPQPPAAASRPELRPNSGTRCSCEDHHRIEGARLVSIVRDLRAIAIAPPGMFPHTCDLDKYRDLAHPSWMQHQEGPQPRILDEQGGQRCPGC